MNLKSLSLLSAAGILMTYTINVYAQCDVKYTINSNWGNGATLSVDITNLGTPKTTWELAWNFANAEKVSQLWNGTYTQTGQAMRVKNVGWNGNISTNGTVNFGFNISYPNGLTLVKPAEFYLDGVKCVGKTSSSISSSKSSSSTTSSSRSSISSAYSSSSLRSSSSSLVSSSSKSSISSKSSSSYSSSSSSTPVLAHCTNNLTYGPRLLRVLTREEYINSIRDLTGVDIATDLPASRIDLLLANTRVNGFDNNTRTTINKFVFGNFDKLSGEVVSVAAKNDFANVLNCSNLNGDQCATQFTQGILTRIFRRPASAEEVAQYSSLFSGATTPEQIKAALGAALRTALSSPQFLYRQETGIAVSDIRSGNTAATLPAQPIDNDAYVLTPYELASFLAFTFTGSTPDTELLDAAKNRGLDTDAAIEFQVNRLLNKASGKSHLVKFAEQWLDTENVGSRTASAIYAKPELTPAITQSMKLEAAELFKQIVLDETAPFSKLFASDYSYLPDYLINFYGVGVVNVTSDKITKVTLPASIRQGGLLTSGAFVVSKSAQEPDPRKFALGIRNRILCQDAYGSLAPSAIPQRDDPFWQVGFAYDNLSATSLRRTHNIYNTPINSAGVLTGISRADDGATLSFSSAEDLAQKLSTLDVVRTCFIEHNFRSAFGTGTKTFDPATAGSALSATEQADYACEKERLDYALTSTGSARTMLKRIGSLQAVRYRKDRSQ